MGGTMIAIPYGMFVTGFMNGLIINILFLALMMFITHLYFQAMDVFKLQSISELCYVAMGRRSIYFVNGYFSIILYGVLAMFQILYSKLCVYLFNKTNI